ncbi:MAG TPA: TrmH family RNA methyltransferase [Candidatus Saccharimonadales bacterium]|jgi:tRNA G18 (ribose-2'-O)-methylase SpoU
MRTIVVIAHDIRSTHNVGSLLRTCEGLGVSKLYFTGYTPYPPVAHDTRLPHLAEKLGRQIHKTALDAETLVDWEYAPDISMLLDTLKRDGFQLAALEQSSGSTPLQTYQPSANVALLLGREVEGIEPELLAQCDITLEIPMFGHKESFNVVQAAAMALYQCRFA